MAVSGDGWGVSLAPVGPAPAGGSLSFDVECRTSPRRRGRPHEVTIGPDWSLSTPHDLEAERVGIAFGGYLSCVHLADRVVPGVRDLVQLQARRTLPSLRRVRARAWRLEHSAGGCRCQKQSWPAPWAAVEHLLGMAHWLNRLDAPEFLLVTVADAVRRAHGGLTRPTSDADTLEGDRRLLLEHDGLEQLWAAGIAPELVPVLHRALTASPGDADEPLPAALYVAAVFTEAPASLLAEIVSGTGDPATAIWAAHTMTEVERRDPGARLHWLEQGLARADIEVLLEAGYTVEDAIRIAATTSRTPRRAAHQLATWSRAGCRPSPDDFADLDRAGADEWFSPNRASVAALERETESMRAQPTLTQLGLVLAVAGNARTARRLLARGARDPHAAARLMDRPSHRHHHLEESR